MAERDASLSYAEWRLTWVSSFLTTFVHPARPVGTRGATNESQLTAPHPTSPCPAESQLQAATRFLGLRQGIGKGWAGFDQTSTHGGRAPAEAHDISKSG